MQLTPVCLTCNGEGQVFEGAFMHSNPASYGDYDEVWGSCDHCNGTGHTWKDAISHIVWRVRGLVTRIRYRNVTEEEDIPF